MHQHLQDACKTLGIELPNLTEAAAFTQRTLKQMSDEVIRTIEPEGDCLDVLVFGSLAREEASTGSDIDYVVAVHQIPSEVARTRRLIEAVDTARSKTNLEKPGATNTFGAVISASDLTERIGLEQDTNVTHTRRILLLQESTSIYAPHLRKRLLEAVIDRYLHDYKDPKAGVPRFLLNDIVRYWRTLAVDYQAKRWNSVTPTWGLRYIKLLISRKLAYAGTIASVLLTDKAHRDYYVEQFSMPALARLAQLEPRLEAERKPDLKLALKIADEFVGALADDEFRDEAKEIVEPERIPEGSRFEAMRTRAKELQGALERLFFESEVLKQRSVRYLSF